MSVPEQDLIHSIPPLIARGNLTFFRKLPELLGKHRGEWVAYSGEELIGVGRDDLKLVRRCHARGLKNDQFIVRRVEPWDEDEVSPEEYVK